MKRIILLFLSVCLMAKVAVAVDAYPGLVKFLQPDRTTSLMIYLKGDEKVHWAETMDGYSLVYDDKGYFVYATRDAMGNMVPSEFVATEVENRTPQVEAFLESNPKHLRFSKMQVNAMLSLWKEKDNMLSKRAKAAGITGDRKILVILMGFRDQPFHVLRPLINNMFNQVNYSTYGSVHDYYFENSYGKLNLTADVVGPYVCDSNASFYGRNDNQNRGYQAFAREAIIAASSHVDFSDYDNDGDGVVDCVHILFSGYGEEAGGGADCIWSHKWSLFNPLTFNNTTIATYSCSPEYSSNSGIRQTNIGVVCHEIGHVFGAPDFYDTDYSGSGGEYPGTGKWDIMSNGSWNMSGASPAHHNPYTKCEIYKWTTMKTISSPSCITLQPASRDSASYYKLNTQTPNEYYILENRQILGFDRGLVGHGMIVYHAHSSLASGWGSNAAHPQCLYAVSAFSTMLLPDTNPGSYSAVNTADCPFPGSTRSQTLNDTTTPSLLSWNRMPSGHRLTYIGDNPIDNTVSFIYNDGCTVESSDLTAWGISGTQIQLSWTLFGAQNVLLVVNDTNIFSAPDTRRYWPGDTFSTGERVVASYYLGNNALCNGLQPNKTYYFKLYTMLSDSTYTSGLTCSATTLCSNLSYPYGESFVLDEMPYCWDVVDSVGGSWTVVREGYNRFLLLTPDSASTSVRSQVNTPPLNLSGNGNLVLKIDFQNANDTLIVKYRTPSNFQFQTLQMITAPASSWQTVVLPLPDLCDGYMIAFEGRGTGTVRVDNLKISATHIISVTTDGHGSVNPGGLASVPDGDNASFSIIPEQGYVLNSILLDNVSQALSNPFVISNVTSTHTLHVSFVEGNALSDVSQEEGSVSIVPNPATGKVSLSLSAENESSVSYTIYDMSGRQIAIGTIQPNMPVQEDVSQYRNGVYYIRFVGDTFRKTSKLIVQH